MNPETAHFIADCKASIAAHEAAILKAIDSGNFATVEKLNGYRANLLLLIAKTIGNA